MKDVYSSDNFLYMINKKHQVVDFNEPMAALYPELQKGDTCYSVLMQQKAPCAACPLKVESDEDLNVFNGKIKQWVSVKRARVDIPGEGPCGMLVCSRINDMHKNLKSRLPYMTGYDVFIEMNLTQNNYRVILPNDPVLEKEFSREPINDLITRTANTLVHPDDRAAFLDFWDLNTLTARIGSSENEIHGVFRECRRQGVWDTIYITIVREEYFASPDVLVMALYMIIPSGISTQQSALSGESLPNVDPTTGLPLRRSYWEQVDSCYLRRSGSLAGCAILAADVEHFRVFNSWYGREAGDALLAEIGAFLQKTDKEKGTLSGYIGADNFCTVFLYDEALIAYITNGISAIVENFRDIRGFHPIFGLYHCRGGNEKTVDAYDNCMTAIRRATDHKPGAVCVYDDKLVEEQAAELHLMAHIREALDRGEISFYLQPKCELESGRIVSAEALARWHSPKLGEVSPGVFIPVLERDGFITQLDYYIWESVCRTIAGWKAIGLPVLPVSVNVSRIDIFSMDVMHTFTALAEKYKISPADIEIEITESAYVEDDAIIREVQSGLKAAGFSVLMDDFGSGYSSLNFLKDVDSDAIKLDVRFLDLNESNTGKGTDIIASVLDMSEKLNLAAVAEGIETEEQKNMLAAAGCRLGQGYYFYRPMPLEEYENLLREGSAILSGTHIQDYCPHREQVQPDMLSFRGLDDHLARFLRTLSSAADLVRVVDVRSMSEYRCGGDGHLEARKGHCYDIWGRKENCEVCISRRAADSLRPVSKLETVGEDRYYITARPIRIGRVIYALETAVKIAAEL